MRQTRIALIVVKLLRGGQPAYLMRYSPKWKDISFIGGHEEARDHGRLSATARRELKEEVPGLRGYDGLQLNDLTDRIVHGPVYSRSKGGDRTYLVQFFHLRIPSSIGKFATSVGPRSGNRWVNEQALLEHGRVRVSGYVPLLNAILPHGLVGIPLSSVEDVASYGGEGALRDQEIDLGLFDK